MKLTHLLIVVAIVMAGSLGLSRLMGPAASEAQPPPNKETGQKEQVAQKEKEPSKKEETKTPATKEKKEKSEEKLTGLSKKPAGDGAPAKPASVPATAAGIKPDGDNPKPLAAPVTEPAECTAHSQCAEGRICHKVYGKKKGTCNDAPALGAIDTPESEALEKAFGGDIEGKIASAKALGVKEALETEEGKSILDEKYKEGQKDAWTSDAGQKKLREQFTSGKSVGVVAGKYAGCKLPNPTDAEGRCGKVKWSNTCFRFTDDGRPDFYSCWKDIQSDQEIPGLTCRTVTFDVEKDRARVEALPQLCEDQ